MSNQLEASTGAVRAGQSSYSDEEWRQRLNAFLLAQGETGRVVEVRRPAGGNSAASVIFIIERNQQNGVSSSRFVARLKPERSFFATFDPAEQFTVQRSLHLAGLPVPAALWLDADGQHLGQPGYVMEFASGASSTPSYFTDGPMSNITAEKRFRMMRNMIGTLAEFHRKADPVGLDFLAKKGRGNTLIEREINMWFDLIDYARPELTPRYAPIRDWLVDTAPDVPDPVVLHGDYQGSNVLWNGEEVSAILDFEVVRIGPPESDVAYQCNLDELSAGFFGGLRIELPSLAQRAAWYEEASDIKLNHLDYHFTRAVFQIACGVVAFTRGLEQDVAVAPTPFMNYLNRRLLKLLPKSLPFEPKLPVSTTTN